jgi:serine/threonine-protein kinase RsbW
VVVEETKTQVYPGRYESLPLIGENIRKACESAGFDSCTAYYIETAVDEACSNIIEHAYGGENIGEIKCVYTLDADSITIILQDKGNSFNPDQVTAPDLQAPLEDRKNHGLGLYFIRKIMDEVTFESSPENGNILTLKKHKITDPDLQVNC